MSSEFDDLPQFFIDMVDELVKFSEYDPELQDSLQWIDEESKKEGTPFYKMVYRVLAKYDASERAKAWRVINKNG